MRWQGFAHYTDEYVEQIHRDIDAAELRNRHARERREPTAQGHRQTNDEVEEWL